MARLLLREALGGGDDIPEEDVKGYAAPYHEVAAKHAFLVTARSIVSETATRSPRAIAPSAADAGHLVPQG